MRWKKKKSSVHLSLIYTSSLGISGANVSRVLRLATLKKKKKTSVEKNKADIFSYIYLFIYFLK